MTTPTELKPMLREALLSWMKDRDKPFTVDDVAERFSKHYQTAWKWMRRLEFEGMIEEHPMTRGRASQWVLCVSPDTGDQRAVRIAHGNKQLTIAEWAGDRRGAPNVAIAAKGLLYLFIRSYYEDAPDHQHLRGRIPAADVRAIIARQLDLIEEDVSVIRQLLAYRGPWQEGSELAQRFGVLPVGTTMLDVAQEAELFDKLFGPKDAEFEESKPAPAPAVEQKSVTEVLDQLGSSSNGPDTFTEPPSNFT